MIDIKIFTYGGGAGGQARRGQGALSVQKNKKITRTVPILTSDSTYFSFFFLQWILKIFHWGGTRGQAWGGWIFFLRISILFHQCNNKNITYQQFLLLFTLYYLHIVHIDVFFPSPEKLTFGCKKLSSPTVFDLDG